MNGSLIPNTPIAVDFWKVRECPHAKIFLLTHLHGDHVTGLTSTWRYPIYCSEITGKLLMCRYGIKKELIHSLEIGSPQIVYLDKEHTEQMTLTALDANHCPGAVMYLMEGYFGTILHTGDFRFQPDMIQNKPLVDYAGKVNMLYLDNTYCSPSCQFPTRSVAIDRIIEIIQSHPSYNIVFGLRSLGKENMLLTIAQFFQEYVSVTPQMFKTLQILEAPDVFAVDSDECRFQVKPFHTISNKFVARLNEVHPTIVILPTALYCGIDARPYENQDNVFIVPYSDHSSYLELQHFVSFIRPQKIIPIVKGQSRGPFGMSIADRADMSQFQAYISSGMSKRCDVPNTVKMYMLAVADVNGNRSGMKRKLSSTKYSGPSKKMKRGVIFDSPSRSHTPRELNDKKEITKTAEKSKHISSTCYKSKKISPQMLGLKLSPSKIKKRKESQQDKRQDVSYQHNDRTRPPLYASSPMKILGEITSRDKVRKWLKSLDTMMGGEMSNNKVSKSQVCDNNLAELKSLGNTGKKVSQTADIGESNHTGNEKAIATTENLISSTLAKDTEVFNSYSNQFEIQASQGFEVNVETYDEIGTKSYSNFDAITDSPVRNKKCESLVQSEQGDKCATDHDRDGLVRITDSFYNHFENEIEKDSCSKLNKERSKIERKMSTVNKDRPDEKYQADYPQSESLQLNKISSKRKKTKSSKRKSHTKFKILASWDIDTPKETAFDIPSHQNNDLDNCSFSSNNSSVTIAENLEGGIRKMISRSNDSVQIFDIIQIVSCAEDAEKAENNRHSGPCFCYHCSQRHRPPNHVPESQELGQSDICNRLKSNDETIVNVPNDPSHRLKYNDEHVINVPNDSCDRLKSNNETVMNSPNDSSHRLESNDGHVINDLIDSSEKLESNNEPIIKVPNDACERLESNKETVINASNDYSERLESNNEPTIKVPNDSCERLESNEETIMNTSNDLSERLESNDEPELKILNNSCDRLDFNDEPIVNFLNDSCDNLESNDEPINVSSESGDIIKSNDESIVNVPIDSCDRLESNGEPISNVPSDSCDRLESNGEPIINVQSNSCEAIESNDETINTPSNCCERMEFNGEKINIPNDSYDSLETDNEPIINVSSDFCDTIGCDKLGENEKDTNRSCDIVETNSFNNITASSDVPYKSQVAHNCDIESESQEQEAKLVKKTNRSCDIIETNSFNNMAASTSVSHKSQVALNCDFRNESQAEEAEGSPSICQEYVDKFMRCFRGTKRDDVDENNGIPRDIKQPSRKERRDDMFCVKKRNSNANLYQFLRNKKL